MGGKYPGMLIGNEPTTDKFNVIMRGDDVGEIPGHALAVNANFQFKPLQEVSINK